MPIIVFLSKLFLMFFSLKVVRFFLMAFILLGASEIIGLLIEVFVPQFSSICNLLSAVPSELGFFLQYFEIPYAVNTILSAYLIRFAVRRLPFVG